MDAGLGLLLLLLLSRRKSSPGVAITVGPGRRVDSASFASLWASRANDLMNRAKSGARWVPRMTARLGSPAAGAAAGRWIGIESGGNPLAASNKNERGLAQVDKQSLSEMGLTQADFDAMASPATSDDKHADLAAKVMTKELLITSAADTNAPDPGWGPAIGPIPGTGNSISVNGMGIAKLRHGLPLFVLEMRKQGHFKNTIPATIASALGPNKFVPSQRLAAFAKGVHDLTGDPTKNLLLRFLVPAAVVAHAEDAAVMGRASFVVEGVS